MRVCNPQFWVLLTKFLRQHVADTAVGLVMPPSAGVIKSRLGLPINRLVGWIVAAPRPGIKRTSLAATVEVPGVWRWGRVSACDTPIRALLGL